MMQDFSDNIYTAEKNGTAISDISMLPTTMRNQCLVLYGSSFIAIIITILMLIVVQFNMTYLLSGIGVAAICGFLAVRNTKKFMSGDYHAVNGTCIDSYLTGKLKWKMREILIATEDNDTYSFSVSAQRNYRILAGDKVTVYIPTGTQFYEKDGVNVIPAFYGYERHK